MRVPCTNLGVLRRSVYQMISSIDKVLDEGNCRANVFARATDRGEEACECVVKPTNLRHLGRYIVVGRILVKAARLRTETSYKAGLARRVATTQRSRSQIADLVNDELAQRNITLLSGETCQAACESSFAPTSRACPKGWNAAEQSAAGEAGVSRGHSTDPRIPIETGRTEQ